MDSEHKIKFGTLHENGTVIEIRQIKQIDIGRCPQCILEPNHYREDGSCKCDDPEEQKMMIREWGYKRADFKKKAKHE
jgi:hypothetical protein